MRVQEAPPEHYGWLAERNHLWLPTDFRALEAVDENGAIRGMGGFMYWTPNSVQTTIYVDSPAALRALVRPFFSYPFEDCGRGVLLALVPSHSPVLLIAMRAGFAAVHRIADGFQVGDDMLLLEMRRENCRWLKKGAA